MREITAVRLAAAATAMALSACTNAPPLDRKAAARDEIAVLTAAYREFVGPREIKRDATRTDTLYISARYRGYDNEAEMTEYLRPEIGVALARAYAKANAQSGWLAGPPASGRAHVVFAADSLLPRTTEDHAPVLEFSKAGFNASRDSAVVQVGFHCGGLCGRWQMQLLLKGKDGQWYTSKRFFDAVS